MGHIRRIGWGKRQKVSGLEKYLVLPTRRMCCHPLGTRRDLPFFDPLSEGTELCRNVSLGGSS